MKQLIAYCGLDCERCDARIATVLNDNKLRENTARLWRELNNTPDITAETINCMGCRSDGVKTVFCGNMCEIRKCASNRGFDTCGDCQELDNCLIVGAIFKHNPIAKDNLAK